MENNNNDKLSILKTTGRFGVKGLKYFLLVILLFASVNILSLIIAAIYLKGIDSTSLYAFGLILISVLGALFTIIALYFTYKYLVTDGLTMLYKQASPFFMRLCSIIGEKIRMKDTHIEKAINVGGIIGEVYGQKIPRPAQKGITFIVNRIPFSDIILNIKNGIGDREEQKISSVVYEQVDSYIINSILGNNSMKWILWLLPINALIQFLLIYFIGK